VKKLGEREVRTLRWGMGGSRARIAVNIGGEGKMIGAWERHPKSQASKMLQLCRRKKLFAGRGLAGENGMCGPAGTHSQMDRWR
jgi:hypothetical protein